MGSGTAFDHDIRVLICKSCGAPLPAPRSGGMTRCEYCGATSLIQARPRATSPSSPQAVKSVGRGPVSGSPALALPEPARLRHLRTQIRDSLSSPTSLPWSVMWWHGQRKPKLAARALVEWNKARTDLEAGRDREDAEARLYFLTLCFTNYYGPDDAHRIRAMLETACELCRDRRHQHVLLSRMVRCAAHAGDLESAEAWLADCDARSEDIYIDTSWRLGRACIDLYRRNYVRVLEVLGDGFDDVPIACAFDQAAALYRADAHEKLGRIDRAVHELTVAQNQPRVSPRIMLQAVHDQPNLDLVPHGRRRVLVPRLRRRKLLHRAWLVTWLGGTLLLTLQWLTTRSLTAAVELESLHLFEVHSVVAPLAVLILGVIPHWRWSP
jgi:DNA-directed RNA polymerase subunit RPC12/RpoP